jgi:looped-hinge helix DNA binding domain, AbrB family
MSEFILNVGKKGEIYTTKKIRDAIGLKENSKVIVKIKDGFIIVEPLPKIEELINKSNFVNKISLDELDEELE